VILGVAGRTRFAMRYEANEQPDSETWLQLDEIERVERVMDYHRRTRVELANPKLHAMTHVVVENQLALGDATRFIPP
jgi:hypothetical protein